MSALAPVRALPVPPRPARSTATARSTAVAEPRPAAAERPRLVVVPRPTAGRVPFVLAVGGVLAIGLVALLLLHTLAAQDAFTVHKLTYRSASLADQEQALTVANEQAQAPSSLALRASGLGMVPAQSLRVTRLHGRPAALLYAPEPLPPAPSATPSPSAKPTTSATPTHAATKPAAKPTIKPTVAPH